MTRLSNNKHIIKPRTGPLAATLTPEWAELLNLTPDRYARSSLNRLFRLASHLNLKPDEVCNETLQRLEVATAGENITRPKQASRDAARYWNSMRELHPQWPRQILAPPAHRKVFVKLEDMSHFSFDHGDMWNGLRPTANAGAYYDIAPNQRISVNGFAGQQAWTSRSYATGLLGYQIAF